MHKTQISILITGDIVPTLANEKLFEEGSVEELVGAEIVEIFHKVDISAINLECPLTTSEDTIQKNGPNLKASPKSIMGFKNLNPTIIGLANNHIMDFGEDGLRETLRILDRSQLRYAGVGNNLEEATASIQIVEKKGWRVGFYACAEHEFSIATEHAPGANPFNPLITGDLLKRLKSDNSLDKLVVLFHGGKEYYQYPSPGLQQICRHFVEKGVDLVVCQHSHCIGAYEHYLSGDIVYGQGNFLFDTKNPLSHESLLISYHLDDDGTSSIDFYPIRRRVDGSGTVNLAKGEDAESILSAFNNRSEEIKQPGFIEKHYAGFALQLIAKLPS